MTFNFQITFNDGPTGAGDSPQLSGRISRMVVTNNSGESIGYSSDSGSSFATLTAGSSVTLGAGDPTSFRFRRVNSGSYPLAVDAVVTMSVPMSEGYFDTNPTTGGGSLLAGDTRITQVTTKRGRRAPLAYVGESMKLSDFSLEAGAGVVLSMSTINGRTALKVDVPAGAIVASINILPLINNTFNGELFVQVYGARADQFDGVTAYVAPDNYVNYVSASVTLLGSVVNSAIEQGAEHTIRLGKEHWTVTGTITYPFIVNKCKININPVSSSAYTVYITGVGFAQKKTKGRVSIVVDDGYETFFKLGQPLADDRNIPITHAIIPAFIDAKTNGAVSLSVLQSIVNNGGAVIAHGPNFPDGYINGNLFTRYTTTAERINDIKTVINWIAEKGLATPDYEKCYIYPQGVIQTAYRDFDLLNAILENGITTARMAAGFQAIAPTNFDAASKYQHLCLPIIGHSWAGTTAAETTNVNNVVARINAAAVNGTDCIVMLHSVKVTGTADGSMGGNDIRVSDLTTILDAIKAKVDNGTMDAVLFTEYATERAGNFWQQ